MKKEEKAESDNATKQTLSSNQVRGRLAPSPTGRMHAGNIFAALAAWLIAKAQGGQIVLRIEDLDTNRSKPFFAEKVQRDFERLGLFWDEGPFFQHTRFELYEEAFSYLLKQNVVYPCFCSRADLHAASAPHQGEKFIYQGTCRNLTELQRLKRQSYRNPAMRLMTPSAEISFLDDIQGCYTQNLARDCGDFIIRRSDGVFAYQFAVVVDDAQQGINSVVRGVDLLSSTPQQKYLQNLLGFPHPRYAHVPLLVTTSNRRLSKRDADASFDMLLERFKTPEAIIGYIAGITGLAPVCDPATPEELLSSFSFANLPRAFPHLERILWR